jgi:hypothetical protein
MLLGVKVVSWPDPRVEAPCPGSGHSGSLTRSDGLGIWTRFRFPVDYFISVVDSHWFQYGYRYIILGKSRSRFTYFITRNFKIYSKTNHIFYKTFWEAGKQVYLLILVNFHAPGPGTANSMRIHADLCLQHWLYKIEDRTLVNFHAPGSGTAKSLWIHADLGLQHWIYKIEYRPVEVNPLLLRCGVGDA